MKIATKLTLTVAILASVLLARLWLVDSLLQEQRDLLAAGEARRVEDLSLIAQLRTAAESLDRVLGETSASPADRDAHVQRGRVAWSEVQRAAQQVIDSPRLGEAGRGLAKLIPEFQTRWLRYESLPAGDLSTVTYRLRELRPFLLAGIAAAQADIARAAEDAARRDHQRKMELLEEQRTCQFISSAFLLLVVAAIAVYWNSALLRPLKRMEQDAQAVGTGQRSDIRLSYHGNDEIGAVAHAFNSALGRLHQSTTSRDELERVVAQRTAELAESNARAQKVIESSGQGYWDWDRLRDHLSFHGHWPAMLGYRSDEVGSDFAFWDAMMHPDDRDRIHAALEAHIRGDSPHFEVEQRVRTASGGWKWILTRGLIVERDAQGIAIRMAGTNTDIHARKMAEEETRRREDQLRQLSDNLPEGALFQFIVGRDGSIRNSYIGEGFKRLLGFDTAKVLADPDWLIRHTLPEDQPALRAANAQAIRERTPFRHEARLRAANGEVTWLSFRAHPRPTPEGETVWDGVMLDITARHEAELALSRQLEVLATLHQTAIDLLNHPQKDSLLQAIVERTGRILSAQHVELSLLEPGEELVTRACIGPSSTLLGDRVTRATAKLSWAAIDTRSPQVVDSYSARPDTREVYAKLGLDAAAVFPILHGDACLGVLGLGRTQIGQSFDRFDVQKGQLLAQLVALVLHNSSIYEDALRVAEERTRDLRDNEWSLREAQRIAHIGNWEFSLLNGNDVERWSDETYRIFGLEPQSVLITSEEFEKRIHPDDLPALRIQLDDVKANPRRTVLDYRIVRPDGSVRYVHDESEPKRDAAGRIVSLQGIVQDVTDRAMAEAALRDREKLYRSLVETIDHGHYVADFRSIFTYTSPTLEAMGGFASGELLGRSSFRLIAAEDRARVMDDYRRWRDDPTIENARSEFRVVAKDGRKFWVEQSTHFVRDARRRVIEGRNILRDISERRAAEQILREREERFRSVFDLSPIPIVLARMPRGDIVAANPAAERTFGLSLAEALGRTTLDLGLWENPDERTEFIKLLATRESITGHEVRLRTRAGAPLRVLFSVSLVRIAGESYALSSMIDVTSQKRAEDSLRESEARYRALVETSADAIFLLDSTGRIRSANKAAAQMHGYTLDELIGRPVFDLDVPGDREKAPERLRQLLHGEPLRMELQHCRKDGSIFPLEIVATPLTINGETFILASERDITERRRAEEESRRLALLARQTDNGVVVTDSAGCVEWVNEAWTETTGYTLDEVRGRTLGPILQGPGTDAATAQRFREAVRAREHLEVEILNYRKDGDPFWVRIAVQPTYDSTGRHTGFFSIARDITDRKLEADTLAFFSTARPDISPARYFDEVSSFLARLLGVRFAYVGLFAGPADARVIRQLGGHPTELVLDDLPVNSTPCGKLQHQTSFIVPSGFLEQHPQYEYLRAFGAVGYAGVQITARERPIGVITLVDQRPLRRPQRIQAILQLVAPRLGAEIVRRESEQRFRAVFEQSPAMILLLTFPEGRIVEVNRAAERGFGFRRDDVLGRTSLELNAWGRPEDRRHYLDRLTAQRHVESYETRMRRSNGEEFIALFNGALIEVDGEQFTLNAIQDITGQRRTEQRLRQTQKIESLGTLAGGIAHDFNNILTGMFGFVELTCAELPPTHPAQPWLENITAACRRARNLVQQILTFSRQNEGERMPVDVAAIATEALRLLRSTLPPMVQIEEHFAPQTPRVLADSTQLHQVVMNLCTNAWHALPETGGRIRVTVEAVTITEEQAAAQTGSPRGRVVRLTVSDNGIGMSPDLVERIFDPFFTTKPAGKGTGLGLAVVHGAVRAHGGVIQVQSSLGKGTTFEILLPSIEVAAATPLPAPALPRGRGQRILLIDDEPLGRTALASVLEHLGYRVEHFEQPEVALSRFKSNPAAYALVVTDFAMPGMTGRDVTQAVIELRADIPVLLISGYLDSERQAQLKIAGVSRFLRKPPTIEELARAVAALLEPSGSERSGQI